MWAGHSNDDDWEHMCIRRRRIQSSKRHNIPLWHAFGQDLETPHQVADSEKALKKTRLESVRHLLDSRPTHLSLRISSFPTMMICPRFFSPRPLKENLSRIWSHICRCDEVPLTVSSSAWNRSWIWTYTRWTSGSWMGGRKLIVRQTEARSRQKVGVLTDTWQKRKC